MMHETPIASYIYDIAAVGVRGLPKWCHDQTNRGRPGLAQELADRGVQLAITRAACCSECGTISAERALHPVYHANGDVDVVRTTFEPLPLEEIGDVVLSRWSEHYGCKLDLPMPAINEAPIQRLGGNKLLAYRKVLEPLGVGIPTFDLHDLHERDLPPELTERSSRIFVKLARGALSEGLQVYSSADEFTQALPALRASGRRHIVQPGYDFTGTLPGLRPFSEPDREQFDALNKPEVAKELRTYCFYDRYTGATRFWPVWRVSAPDRPYMGESSWLYVDPASCPERFERNAARIVRRIVDLYDPPALYMAVDASDAIAPGEREPDYRVVEVNLRWPFLSLFVEHPEVGKICKAMLADQIASVAMSHSLVA